VGWVERGPGDGGQPGPVCGAGPAAAVFRGVRLGGRDDPDAVAVAAAVVVMVAAAVAAGVLAAGAWGGEVGWDPSGRGRTASAPPPPPPDESDPLLSGSSAESGSEPCRAFDGREDGSGLPSPVAADVRRLRGPLSRRPGGRPVGRAMRGARRGSRWRVSSDQVRPVQMSRMAFSLTPYSCATEVAEQRLL
jgi:hypothetical protein